VVEVLLRSLRPVQGYRSQKNSKLKL